MKLKYLLAPAIAAAFFFGCKKEDTVSTPVNAFHTYSSMDTIYQMLGVKSKFVTIDAASGGSFYGNSGTKFTFPAGCFQDGTGASVTGSVNIEVAEYLEKGDMVFSKMLPTSNDQPLVSAGQVYVHATQAGQELFLKPGYRFRADMPQGKPGDPAMQLFRGQTYPTNGNFASATNVNWVGKDSLALGAIIVNNDTVSILADSMNYWNGDHYLSGVPTTGNNKLNITSPLASASLEGMRLMVLVDHTRNVWPIYCSAWMNFSVGTEVNSFLTCDQPSHIIAYGLINKRFYAGTVGFTANMSGSNSYTLNVVEVDPLTFKNQLNSLY